MLRSIPTSSSTSTLLLITSRLSSSSTTSFLPFLKFPKKPSSFPTNTQKTTTSITPKMNWLGKLGFGTTTSMNASSSGASEIAQSPDEDIPSPGQEFAQFGAGCFWGVELAFQRVPGVSKTEVGYSQGFLDNPTYNDICTGTTNHSEVGGDVGTQYRSGIYFYSPEQEKTAKESMERQEKIIGKKIVTEILPAKKFYRAEEYHQQYLAKGGRFGFRQSTEKGCNDPIRCYG
ncbi:hypothetical protein MKW94_026639 [Papaver nudicaule]|uniref:peptide-methionine (S)-S-oxide reductase n=1 Tax=Papaver nudicaule TaxID=74823 RepID=A0AA41S420_PAPNU|nr:hypothetical protein [Papaver nudicaule]